MLMNTQRAPRHVHIGRVLGIVVVAVLIVLLLVLSVFDWNRLRRPIERMASADLHRQVHIDHLSVQLWRRNPSARIDGLSIANPSWAPGNMAQIGSIDLAIEPWRLFTGHLVLARLQIDQPQVTLLRDADNRANWDFSSDQEEKQKPQKPGPPAHIPAIHLFTMNGGLLTVNDRVRKLTFDGSVSADERKARSASGFELKGHGRLNDKPFELTFTGSPLFNIQFDKPYDYDALLRAGELQATARGAIDHPFDMAHLSSTVDFRGENLASLHYLTGLALPFTPPFHLSGDLRRDGMLFSLKNLQGTIGDSDLHGDIRVDASGERPKFNANLISHALDLSDLAPSVGAGVQNDKGSDAARTHADTEAPKSQQASGKLLPTYQFDFDGLRSMDASVELRADAVKTQKMPIQAVDLKLVLEHGVLTLDPADLTLPQGKLGGAIRINAEQSVANTSIDLRLSNVKLAQFRSAKMSEPPIEGDLLSRVVLNGTGNSVHDILASSNGELVAVIPDGQMREGFAELMGINVARALGLLMTGSQKADGIRCGIAAFKVDQGKASAQPLVLDMDTVDITGSGGFDFNTEDLNLRLKGASKRFDPLRVRAPIIIHGTLAKPSIGLDPKSLAAQGGIAAALGVVATPVAALAAFIDPGLAKNQDCAKLLSSGPEKAAEHPGPPQLTRK
jgi:uncharacterized protein involved in outer membrane biogenesis